MARSKSTGTQAPPVKSDVWVGLLVISLLAQIAAAVFFYLDWSAYPSTQPSVPPPLQITSGGSGGVPGGAAGLPAGGGLPAAGGPPMAGGLPAAGGPPMAGGMPAAGGPPMAGGIPMP